MFIEQLFEYFNVMAYQVCILSCMDRGVTILRNLYHDNSSFMYHDNRVIALINLVDWTELFFLNKSLTIHMNIITIERENSVKY